MRLIRAARQDTESEGARSDQSVTLQTRLIYRVAAALIDDRRWKDMSGLLREIEDTPGSQSVRAVLAV